MDMQRAIAKAEDDLCREYNEGLIDKATFRAEMRAVANDEQAAAEEAAQDAYDREMERW